MKGTLSLRVKNGGVRSFDEVRELMSTLGYSRKEIEKLFKEEEEK